MREYVELIENIRQSATLQGLISQHFYWHEDSVQKNVPRRRFLKRQRTSASRSLHCFLICTAQTVFRVFPNVPLHCVQLPKSISIIH